MRYHAGMAMAPVTGHHRRRGMGKSSNGTGGPEQSHRQACYCHGKVYSGLQYQGA